MTTDTPVYGHNFPHSGPPARKLHCIDLTKEIFDQHFAMRVLQGLVAREQPRIVLNAFVRDYHPEELTASLDLDDTIWLRRLSEKGFEIEPVDSCTQLVAMYRDHVRGAVVYEDRGMHNINLALMIAAQEDAIPCTPTLLKDLKLPVIDDIRGRWDRACDAYRWALENLRSRCHPTVLAATPDRHFNMMDYLTQFKIFTSHLDNFHSDEELAVFKEFLASAPVGGPVMGVWDLFYAKYQLDPERDFEREFIDIISEQGHYFVVTHDCSNMSFHSGMPSPVLEPEQPAVARPVEPGKTYLGFVFSEGDNVTFQTRNRPTIWEDKGRGITPIGWSIAPAMYELFPDVVAYYENSRGHLDTWLWATSGIGYCFPGRLGAALSPEDRELAFSRYLELTDEACRAKGVSLLWILDHRPNETGHRTSTEYVADPDVIARIVKGCPSVSAVLCDYPDMFDTRDFAPKHYMVGDVPVMHARNAYKPGLSVADQIRGLAADSSEGPFIVVFMSGWSESPSSVNALMRELGPEFVALSPADLAATYAQWAKTAAREASAGALTAGGS